MTSRDVVDIIVRRCPRKTKVGHAGTLDPLATGVLVVAVGPATKLIQYAQGSSKSYIGNFRLGHRSDTEDITGEVEEIPNAAKVTEQELKEKLGQFHGTIQQTPPMYSAVKVDGQRAYKAARKGISLDIAARPVQIDAIELLEFSYPDFSIKIDCGKGTYVRTLGRDISRSVGSDCVMTDLCRTAVGSFPIESSINLDQIKDQPIEYLLHDPLSMVGSLPKTVLDSDQTETLRHGKRLSALSLNIADEAVEELAAVNGDDQLLAILKRKSAAEFGSKINFVPVLYN